MKIPSIIARYLQIENENDEYGVHFKKKTAYLILAVLGIVIVLAVGMIVWSIAHQAELVQLRQQTQLQSEQLKLLQTKTETLDKKLQVLDSLDQEIRQMVKGSESGATPEGGGLAETPQPPSDESLEILSPAQLSAKLSRMDAQAQKRLVSFYTLRNILRDGIGADIASVSSINFAAGSGNANATTPSIWPATGVITDRKSVV